MCMSKQTRHRCFTDQDNSTLFIVADLCHFVLSCFRGEKAKRRHAKTRKKWPLPIKQRKPTYVSASVRSFYPDVIPVHCIVTSLVVPRALLPASFHHFHNVLSFHLLTFCFYSKWPMHSMWRVNAFHFQFLFQ